MTRIAMAAVLLCVVAGCSSTPPSHFYTLSATAKPTASASKLSVSVGPVTVPAVVDRPEIVVRTGANEVWLDEFNRWAAPLEDNVSRVIAENLVAMLSTPHVTVFPQSEGIAVDYRVAIQVQTFESAPGDAATLEAVWSVRGAKDAHRPAADARPQAADAGTQTRDARTKTGRTSVREPVQGSGYPALVAAHSRAVARLSQDIADAIRALESGSPASRSTPEAAPQTNSSQR